MRRPVSRSGLSGLGLRPVDRRCKRVGQVASCCVSPGWCVGVPVLPGASDYTRDFQGKPPSGVSVGGKAPTGLPAYPAVACVYMETKAKI